MKHFQRIHQSVCPGNSEGDLQDARVSDLGYLYRKENDNYWRCLGLLQDQGRELFDVQGEPLWDQGQEGDAAVTLRGDYWRHQEDGWAFIGNLCPSSCQDMTVNNLRIRGNFAPPVAGGRIPICYPNGNLFGWLTVEPKG